MSRCSRRMKRTSESVSTKILMSSTAPRGRRAALGANTATQHRRPKPPPNTATQDRQPIGPMAQRTVSQLLMVIDEDALDQDDARGRELVGGLSARVRREVVRRHLDRPPRPQRAQVLDEQRGLERVRVVKVGVRALLDGEVRERPVVRVVRDVHQVLAPDTLGDCGRAPPRRVVGENGKT
eukprot:2245361-Prymnesium_polylepis.1